MAGNISEKQRADVIAMLESIKKDSGDLKTETNINLIENYINQFKYGLVFEKHEEKVEEMCKNYVPIVREIQEKDIITDSSKPLNFIIEGDNLHALKILQKTHKRSLDAIYIDPPYNTGAKDWKYNNDFVDKNDRFRHSKWLSMMNSRLQIAKTLLKETGVLICAIDENELATVSLLLSDVFGEDYNVDTICIVQNPRGIQGDNFSYVNEYALFVYKKGLKVIEDRHIEDDEVEFSQFRNWGAESERTDAKNCFYPVFVKNGKIIGCGQVPADDVHPHQTEYDPKTDTYSVYPIDIGGVERKWRYATQSFDDIKDMLRAKASKDGKRIEIEIGKTFGTFKTVWTDKKYDANEYGTKLINDMVPTNDFDFPKSLYNTYDCLAAVIRSKPNAVVLDFFAGSGTTGHAVLLMNKLLGGNRRFILCTNNDVGDKKETEFKKAHPELVDENNKIKKDSPEFIAYQEKFGIASSITRPRIEAAIKGYETSSGAKTIIWEEKLTTKSLLNLSKMEKIKETHDAAIEENKSKFNSFKEEIDKATYRVYGIDSKKSHVDGLGGNCLYYKADFVEKNSEDYNLSDLLLLNSKELIKLKFGFQINEKYYIDTDEKLDYVMNHLAEFSGKNIFITSNMLIGDNFRAQFAQYKIKNYDIPNFFYANELAEVGETW